MLAGSLRFRQGRFGGELCIGSEFIAEDHVSLPYILSYSSIFVQSR